MIKKCKFCGKEKEMSGKRRYCNAKCKKAYENSLQSGKRPNIGESHLLPPSKGIRPECLGGAAADYWDKVAPLLIKRGHLNSISEDIFIELCDLKQRLGDINKAINETNRSLLQVDDKWDNKNCIETQSFKESALSDIKRKYSRLLLDYCKQFYLTPLSNRGNFGITEEETDPLDEFIKGQNGK